MHTYTKQVHTKTKTGMQTGVRPGTIKVCQPPHLQAPETGQDLPRKANNRANFDVRDSTQAQSETQYFLTPAAGLRPHLQAPEGLEREDLHHRLQPRARRVDQLRSGQGEDKGKRES